jgi:hypothetical protein
MAGRGGPRDHRVRRTRRVRVVRRRLVRPGDHHGGPAARDGPDHVDGSLGSGAGVAFAAYVLTMLPLFALVAVTMKHFVAGVTAGSGTL